jgi:hypothetical protein
MLLKKTGSGGRGNGRKKEIQEEHKTSFLLIKEKLLKTQ